MVLYLLAPSTSRYRHLTIIDAGLDDSVTHEEQFQITVSMIRISFVLPSSNLLIQNTINLNAAHSRIGFFI